jgi:hypothetical protein
MNTIERVLLVIRREVSEVIPGVVMKKGAVGVSAFSLEILKKVSP